MRQLRVGENLRHILAGIFQREEYHDAALLDQTITVTEVRVSPDLRNATAYVLPLGGTKSPEVMAALDRLRPHVRRLVGQRAKLRNTPQITFAWDALFDQAERIERVLRDPRVHRDLDPTTPPLHPSRPDAT